MPEIRRGRQTPTRSFILPYTETRGAEAVELYAGTGRIAQEWQALLLYDILAITDEGLWTHSKFGYSVPRRNGKNEIVAMREMYGLHKGETILHTAHRTTTSHSAWERLCGLLDSAGTEYASVRATGRERIQLDTGGRIELRTRSTKGGRRIYKYTALCRQICACFFRVFCYNFILGKFDIINIFRFGLRGLST